MTSLEYKVLKYLCSHSPCHVRDIAKHLSKEESLIETQFSHLEKSNFVSPKLRPYHEDRIFAILHTGVYSITDEGKLAYENYLQQKKDKTKDKWEERSWRTISLVALIVAILSFLQSLHIINLSR